MRISYVEHVGLRKEHPATSEKCWPRQERELYLPQNNTYTVMQRVIKMTMWQLPEEAIAHQAGHITIQFLR